MGRPNFESQPNLKGNKAGLLDTGLEKAWWCVSRCLWVCRFQIPSSAIPTEAIYALLEQFILAPKDTSNIFQSEPFLVMGLRTYTGFKDTRHPKLHTLEKMHHDVFLQHFFDCRKQRSSSRSPFSIQKISPWTLINLVMRNLTVSLYGRKSTHQFTYFTNKLAGNAASHISRIDVTRSGYLCPGKFG